MSKASEWAVQMAKYQAAEAAAAAAAAEVERNIPEMLTFYIDRDNGVRVGPALVAHVKDDGQLSIGRDHRWLKPDEAIAFACWIIDTFGEPTP